MLQSLAFIAGYSVHQYLKLSKPCHIGLNLFTFDKAFLLDLASDSEFKLLQLTDRGGLKYPSEPILNIILVSWKIFYAIENNKELLAKLVNGSSRKILVELTLMYLEDSDNRDTNIWKSNCVKDTAREKSIGLAYSIYQE